MVKVLVLVRASTLGRRSTSRSEPGDGRRVGTLTWFSVGVVLAAGVLPSDRRFTGMIRGVIGDPSRGPGRRFETPAQTASTVVGRCSLRREETRSRW